MAENHSKQIPELETIRHSAAHLMAQTVDELFPNVKFGIGPAIENGFYYDFDVEEPFTDEDLKRIEKRMKENAKKKIPIERVEMDRNEAIDFFRGRGQDYKAELIEEIEDDTVSCYRQGSFIDLCRGPHVEHTGRLKIFKLLSVAGAYWRGDEKNRMLQRIYGTAFQTKKDLKEYLDRIEEAKKRDHRLLGKQLDLFSIHEEMGAGLVYWHPKGAMLKETLEQFWKKVHLERGYQIVATPHIAKSWMWKRSGHYEFYKENMYVIPEENLEYVLKPMNCPGHIAIYNTRIHSYKDLPVRFGELGCVYRQERSGTLHGLMRVRGFTIDDAHIFCTPSQLLDEITGVIDLAEYILTSVGFKDFKVELSVRDPNKPEKYAGLPEDWDRAEGVLVQALEKKGWAYTRCEGEAVFYGPKIDIKLIDPLGRSWQATTVQFDFNLPGRLNINYIDSDGAKKPVVMVHRAVLGSLERFIGTMIEHFAGAFPVWLSPVQVKVMTITDDHIPYGKKALAEIKKAGIRAEGDFRGEKIGAKVRQAAVDKVPYMAIVGANEEKDGSVSIRLRGEGDTGCVPIASFIEMIQERIAAKE